MRTTAFWAFPLAFQMIACGTDDIPSGAAGNGGAVGAGGRRGVGGNGGGVGGGGAAGRGGLAGAAGASTCPNGYFNSAPVGSTPTCAQVTECSGTNYTVAEPTATLNRLCGTCPTGETNPEPNGSVCLPSCKNGGSYVKSGNTFACKCQVGTAGSLCEIYAKDVVADFSYTCALLSDGTIQCWGDNAQGQATSRSGVYTAVTAGGTFSCGIFTSGELSCYGGNDYGELNYPTGKFKAVAAGLNRGCAIAINGTIACWGALGTSPPTGTFVKVSAGTNQFCALDAVGVPTCWGNAMWKDLPVPSGTFQSIAIGYDGACALNASSLLSCWGSSAHPELVPPSPALFGAVDVGAAHACGILTGTDAGKVVCWGANDTGQSTPPNLKFVTIATGTKHTCGITTEHYVACWGDNSNGEVSPP